MEMIENRLKQALVEGQVQVGCWLSLGSHTAAEICACAGFDWVLIDMEHAPNDVPQVLHLLQAAAAYPSSIMVRTYWNDTVLIKRLLDLGVQSLLMPNVQTVEEAQRAVELPRGPDRAGEIPEQVDGLVPAGRGGDGLAGHSHPEEEDAQSPDGLVGAASSTPLVHEHDEEDDGQGSRDRG